MTDKALFTFKLLAVLCIITLVACMAVDALAEPIRLKSVQASGGLRVRQEPDRNSKPVYLLEDTETVIALFELGEWTLVAKNTGDHVPLGWACSQYLK